MSRTLRHSIVAPVLVAMVCALFAAVGGAPAEATAPVTTSSHHLGGSAKHMRKKPYRVKPGPTMNSPYGRVGLRRAIISKILNAIRHTGKNARVRVFSWNIYSWATVNTLVDAMKRGAQVRVIADKSNLRVKTAAGNYLANPYIKSLRRQIISYRKSHPHKKYKSAIKLCDRSCRGTAGAAHSKFVLINKVGASEKVLMQTSSNLTDAAASRQWNGMYTLVGHKRIYGMAVRVFNQAFRDQPVKGRTWRWQQSAGGHIAIAFSPYDHKARQHDRLMGKLKHVKCRGAAAPAGNRHGRTIIRAAPDAIRGNRGLAVARQLRRLWNNGCDVKVGYTVMSIAVTHLLRSRAGRGPVPRIHLVRDTNEDGFFDLYFHMKVYTINGHIGSNRSAYWMQAGSANTSDGSMRSDENYIYIHGLRKPVLRYQNHLNYWFGRFPRVSRTPEIARRIASGEIDPYKFVDMD